MTDDTNQKLKEIKRALYGYHYALDLHEDANVAVRRAIDKVQEILGYPWVPGAVLEDRRRRFTWETGDLVTVERRDSKGS
ncbi:hypothetical protein [Microvirga calopogonii]|uniref:hypothetical protein n=1 Tax=Microvirga calopogonii TaxID=2078013 RepID=UPI000E0D0A72|nr:hypothetical protein [Microvirga calopogonii]